MELQFLLLKGDFDGEALYRVVRNHTRAPRPPDKADERKEVPQQTGDCSQPRCVSSRVVEICFHLTYTYQHHGPELLMQKWHRFDPRFQQRTGAGRSGTPLAG